MSFKVAEKLLEKHSSYEQNITLQNSRDYMLILEFKKMK